MRLGTLKIAAWTASVLLAQTAVGAELKTDFGSLTGSNETAANWSAGTGPHSFHTTWNLSSISNLQSVDLHQPARTWMTQLGYDRRSSGFIYGVELSLTEARNQYQAISTSNPSSGLSLGGSWSLKPKFGFVYEDWMLYGFAGYSNVKTKFDLSAIQSSFSNSAFGRNDFGWLVGFGSQAKLTNQLSVGAEYGFMNSSFLDGHQTNRLGSNVTDTTAQKNDPVHVIQLRAIYRFDK